MREYPFFNADSGAPEGGAPAPDVVNNSADVNNEPNKPAISFPDEASFMNRVSREAKKQVNEFIKSLGFEKEDELKELATKHRENIEAQKSEADKLREVLAAREAQLNEISQTMRLTDIKNELLNSGIKSERINYALKLIDTNSLNDDSGNLDRGKVADAVNNLVADFPELKGQVQAPKAGQDFSQGTNPDMLSYDIIKGMSPEETQRRLPDILKFLSKNN